MEELYCVLVSVCICDDRGNTYDDLGYLFERKHMSFEEADRCYFSVGLTDQQERELWMYLHKHVGPNNGLYLTYELLDDNYETCEYHEANPLGCWDTENIY